VYLFHISHHRGNIRVTEVNKEGGHVMNILIVGGGRIIYFLVKTFLSRGYTVTIINRDRQECRILSRQLKATVVYGDATDSNLLTGACTSSMEIVLALTPNDQDNLVICQLAAQYFGVPRTLALVNDPDNEELFRQLGVTTAFSTTHMISSLIDQRTGIEDIINLFSVADGKVIVTEVMLNQTCPVVGRSLAEIDLPANCLMACILRDQKPVIPRGSTELKISDRIVLITMPDNHGLVLKAITGETN
jgi:trk system potassium uptake protein TrkA